MTEPRTTAERAADTRHLLETAQPGWLATGDPEGRSHLIACTAWWHDGELVVATLGTTRTARNLRATKHARLALGTPDDATLIDLEAVRLTPVGDSPPEIRDGFHTAAGWDPGEISPDWVFVQFRPDRIQAYRGYDEVPHSVVFRQGAWVG